METVKKTDKRGKGERGTSKANLEKLLKFIEKEKNSGNQKHDI